MEPKVSFPHSQELSTGPYSDQDQSSPHTPLPSYLSKSHLDIVYSPTSLSSKLSHSFWVSHQ
jgi:hypothetical protein